MSDPAATAARYWDTLGLDVAGEPPAATVGEQAIRFVRGRELADPATVELEAPGALSVDVLALGVRWRIAG